jgi:hypothetical protein
MEAEKDSEERSFWKIYLSTEPMKLRKKVAVQELKKAKELAAIKATMIFGEGDTAKALPETEVEAETITTVAVVVVQMQAIPLCGTETEILTTQWQRGQPHGIFSGQIFLQTLHRVAGVADILFLRIIKIRLPLAPEMQHGAVICAERGAVMAEDHSIIPQEDYFLAVEVVQEIKTITKAEPVQMAEL